MAIEMTLLLIIFMIFCIIAMTFYFYSRDIIGKIKEIKIFVEKSKKERTDNPYLGRYDGLEENQMNFYFDIGQKSLNNIFKHRDEENKNILSHVAIFGTILSFFYFLGKWACDHHDDLSYFMPLMIYLCAALCHIVAAIWSISISLGLPYIMPPQLYQIKEEYTNTSVLDLKKMYIERYANDAEKNHRSNVQKMELLEYSRFFLKTAAIFLGIAFLFICGKECITFIFV
ncbi:hypothetical protein IKQ19_19445 [Candidatus Saccharibacteria bacterium]|nr:hypothetical protein [Candidatus Saccharibacteria bacterium]